MFLFPVLNHLVHVTGFSGSVSVDQNFLCRGGGNCHFIEKLYIVFVGTSFDVVLTFSGISLKLEMLCGVQPQGLGIGFEAGIPDTGLVVGDRHDHKR